MRHAMIPALFASLCATITLAQQPAAKPAAQTPQTVKVVESQPYILGPAVAQTYPAATYFYVTTTATQKTMPEVMRTVIPHLMVAAKEGGVMSHSPIILVYNGITPDPNAEFEVQAGFIVDTGTKAAGDGQIRQLEAFKCVSLQFTGQAALVAKAYEALFPAMFAAGKMPTQEMRQMVLYHEDEKSNNNIMLIQIGVQ